MDKIEKSAREVIDRGAIMGTIDAIKDRLMPTKKDVAASVAPTAASALSGRAKQLADAEAKATGYKDGGAVMAEKQEYGEAWGAEEEGDKEENPITKSVKAAKAAEDSEFQDAFQNDNFGIDVVKVAAADGEQTEDDKKQG